MFVNSLVALEAWLESASKNMFTGIEDHNAWIRGMGGDPSEMMKSDAEFLEYLTTVVRSARSETYPLWGSLIALLPTGPVKTDAEGHFAAGCDSIGLKTGAVVADWVPIEEEDAVAS